MDDTYIDDVAMTALGQAMLNAVADLREHLELFHPDARSTVLDRYIRYGETVIAKGFLPDQARRMRFDGETLRGVAALSTRQGGVRVSGIVFCARHCPHGAESRFRFSCAVCDSDSYAFNGRGYDQRDVITTDGGQYV